MIFMVPPDFGVSVVFAGVVVVVVLAGVVAVVVVVAGVFVPQPLITKATTSRTSKGMNHFFTCYLLN
jgi:Flp pilus assembly protein TadB